MLIEYRNRNKYGFTELSVVIDTENKTATLYHGMTGPIHKMKHASKKAIRELFNAYAENPLYKAEEK